jgi:hypothetical protein
LVFHWGSVWPPRIAFCTCRMNIHKSAWHPYPVGFCINLCPYATNVKIFALRKGVGKLYS